MLNRYAFAYKLKINQHFQICGSGISALKIFRFKDYIAAFRYF